ncbi:MAG: zinc-binding dehydrogenase, partial [Actinomycetota bacterium]|nr:zinc-binding dehydrogenase [Actinomycetota bacterium]
MKALRIHEDGGPEVLRYEDAPDPEPGPGDVLLRLRAASLNHLDLWVRKGLPSVPKPRILGADGAGVVEALGTGVDGFEVGQRVVVNPGIEHGERISVIGEHMDGTHAELIAVPASNVYPLPDGLAFEEAAAFPLVFETAYRMLVTRAGVSEGEWVLIWGVGGGVASAALAIAKALGARTIVTSTSDDKLARAADLGADAAIPTADARERVKEITDGRGADVVVEHVGEATWATSLAV